MKKILILQSIEWFAFRKLHFPHGRLCCIHLDRMRQESSFTSLRGRPFIICFPITIPYRFHPYSVRNWACDTAVAVFLVCSKFSCRHYLRIWPAHWSDIDLKQVWQWNALRTVGYRFQIEVLTRSTVPSTYHKYSTNCSIFSKFEF